MASNISRYDPAGSPVGFDPLRDFEALFNPFELLRPLQAFDAERIRMDVHETEQAFLIRADIPGARKEDVKVAVDGDQVTISAEVNQDSERKDGNVVRSERYRGQQYRSFTLPQHVDEEHARATYQDGVLELTLPKKAGTGGKQLMIQ